MIYDIGPFQLTLLVDMMVEGSGDLPCWRGNAREAASAFRDRFQLHLDENASYEFVDSLVNSALHNWRTNTYDTYQRCFVGIL